MAKEDIEQQITLRISGAELNKDEGYNLRYILKAFSSIESLVDKTYLYSQSKSQMTKSDKENISVRLVDVKEGSFVADFVIQMNDFLLPLVPLIAENPTQIWEAIKNSYTYIKTVMQAKQEGKELSITLDNNQSGIQVVNTGSGDVHITVNPYVQSLSSKTAPVFSELSKSIDSSNVDSIELMDNQQNNINFTEYEKTLFKKKVYLEEEVIEVNGKIIASNFESLTGKIEIYENNVGIIPDNYRFQVDKDAFDDEEIWKNIFLDEKIFQCQKRITLDPSKGFEEEIKELKLVGIQEP